jgi:NAD(P)-dependent dehydrogenase (short-subunit alcohol dehydrogenase family)
MSDVVVVVGAHTHLGGRIAAALSARGGQEVVRPAPEEDGVAALVGAVERSAGGRRVAAVLHADVDDALCDEVELAELTPEEWQRRCAVPIDRALWTARAGFSSMAAGEGRAGRGGVLGFVCPSVSLTGGAGHVALATATEAIRLLAKSAARRWGRFGITCNAFAPHLDACRPPLPAGGAPGLQVHATALDPTTVDPAEDIASLLLYLCSPGAAQITGATLGTDAGTLMAP